MSDDGEIQSMTSAADRISELPDCILTTILSLLSVGQSARTSILSSRWRSLWLHSAITISSSSLLRQRSTPFPDRASRYSWCVNTFTRIISLHPGPIISCSFDYDYDGSGGWDNFAPTVLQLIDILTLKGIQHLKISFAGRIHPHHPGCDCRFGDFLLPDCLLKCQSLRSLEVVCCIFPNQLPDRSFPNLKELKLETTSIDPPQFYNLLEKCSIAEMQIKNFYNLEHILIKDIVIKSESLVSLSMIDLHVCSTEHLIIEDAPNLKRLLFDDLFTDYCNVEIYNAPKLEVLGIVNMDTQMLRIGDLVLSSCSKLQKFSSVNTRMHSVRALTIRVDFTLTNQGKMIPYLLKCFPCLETLNIAVQIYGSDFGSCPYGNYWKRQFNIDCLENHLKTVELRRYSGEKNALEFAKFIVSNAKVLKVLTLIGGYVQEKNWEKIWRRSLRLSNKASDARVVFMKDRHFSDKFADWKALSYA